jgi:hypothetical protein
MIEETIPQFNEMYQEYMNVFDNVENRILNLDDDNDINAFLGFQKELIKFDANLRLGMAIRGIELNENFARRKFGDLQECHLMFYKLADIWFAYETFFNFHDLTFGLNLHSRKIVWLNDATNIAYSNFQQIQEALTRANLEIRRDFNNRVKRQSLKEYLSYCSEKAIGAQQTRLIQISESIDVANLLPDFQSTSILTMTYAIRNNFVHNGEITIYPVNFSYILKNNLLKILYKYLVVVTICSAKITTEQKLIN